MRIVPDDRTACSFSLHRRDDNRATAGLNSVFRITDGQGGWVDLSPPLLLLLRDLIDGEVELADHYGNRTERAA